VFINCEDPTHMKGKPYGHMGDLDAYSAQTVYPALFERLDSAFPE
jgi:hypothetical protein